MFVLLSNYLAPLNEVDRVVGEHRAYLDRFYASGDLVVSGPQDPRVGGVIIARFASRAQVDTFLAGDPFVRDGIAHYQIFEFTPTRGSI